MPTQNITDHAALVYLVSLIHVYADGDASGMAPPGMGR